MLGIVERAHARAHQLLCKIHPCDRGTLREGLGKTRPGVRRPDATEKQERRQGESKTRIISHLRQLAAFEEEIDKDVKTTREKEGVVKEEMMETPLKLRKLKSLVQG